MSKKARRTREYMGYYVFIKELKKRGFVLSVGDFAHYWRRGTVMVSIAGGYIDDYGDLFPYYLSLNGDRVVGHQRCLKYIDNILKEESK